MHHYLVGGLEHFLCFHILGIIIPTDEFNFFRGVGQPPTSYPMLLFALVCFRWKKPTDLNMSRSDQEGLRLVLLFALRRIRPILVCVWRWGIPSGKRLHSYGKSPFGIGKSTVNEPFSSSQTAKKYQRLLASSYVLFGNTMIDLHRWSQGYTFLVNDASAFPIAKTSLDHVSQLKVLIP